MSHMATADFDQVELSGRRWRARRKGTGQSPLDC